MAQRSEVQSGAKPDPRWAEALDLVSDQVFKAWDKKNIHVKNAIRVMPPSEATKLAYK